MIKTAYQLTVMLERVFVVPAINPVLWDLMALIEHIYYRQIIILNYF